MEPEKLQYFLSKKQTATKTMIWGLPFQISKYINKVVVIKGCSSDTKAHIEQNS